MWGIYSEIIKTYTTMDKTCVTTVGSMSLVLVAETAAQNMLFDWYQELKQSSSSGEKIFG
jgi:hypothetical protein